MLISTLEDEICPFISTSNSNRQHYGQELSPRSCVKVK